LNSKRGKEGLDTGRKINGERISTIKQIQNMKFEWLSNFFYYITHLRKPNNQTNTINKCTQVHTSSFSDKEISTHFSEREKGLYKLLLDKDKTGQLSNMLLGIVKVLNDSTNPMRFSQAANTIRGLADILIKEKEQEIKSSAEYLSEKEINDFKIVFDSLLKKTLSNINEIDEQSHTHEIADRKFREVVYVLSKGTLTRKDLLIELLGGKQKLKIVSEPLQEQVKELAKLHKYFAETLHNSTFNKTEFNDNWFQFQWLLILIVSGFFEIAKQIDQFITEEAISNGKLK
jgi:hypothetical protein